MEKFITLFENIQSTVPLEKILVAIGILLIGKIFQGLFSRIIIGRIEEWTKGTETDLDDRLIEVLKTPLNWTIILVSIWVVYLIFAQNISAQLSENIGGVISVGFVFILSYAIYTAAPVLADILALLTLQTETDLDDLLIPYLPRLFQSIAVAIFIIKASGTLLGASAGALIGILGGAGVALGLLFKDIIYDWCCAVIIYTDGLYRPGDWIAVDGISGFIQVLHIGLRSTKLWSYDWGSVKKIPNSRMISGIVENWSQTREKDLEWGLCTQVSIDSITAEQTDRVVNAIETLMNSLEATTGVLVWFDRIEENARVIKLKAFVNDDNLYFPHKRTINLGILEILEKEGIDHMHVFLRTDPLKLDKAEKAFNN